MNKPAESTNTEATPQVGGSAGAALLACPFCGAVPVSEDISGDTPGMEDCGYWAVECPNCNGSNGKPFVGVHHEYQKIAERIWNGRVNATGRSG